MALCENENVSRLLEILTNEILNNAHHSNSELKKT